MVDADRLKRAVWVTVGHDGYGQLDPSPLVPEQVQHHLLNRASLRTRQSHVLHHSVALAQPVCRPRDEGVQLTDALHVSDTRIVDSGLPREGAYESVRLPSQDTLVVGDGIVGTRLTLGASSFGYGGGEDLRHPGHQNLLHGFMGCVGAGQSTLFTESPRRGSSRKPLFIRPHTYTVPGRIRAH